MNTLLISHRGNLSGSDPHTENSVCQIEKALHANFDVEIDLRYDGKWFLGHDCAQYQVDPYFLKYHVSQLWCHAKNIDAFEKMLDMGLHCFWHQNDCYTLTSRGIIWAYPDHYCKNGILVMPNKEFLDKYKNSIYGICVDNPIDYL